MISMQGAFAEVTRGNMSGPEVLAPKITESLEFTEIGLLVFVPALGVLIWGLLARREEAKKTQEKERQPNQALQTTPVTRSEI